MWKGRAQIELNFFHSPRSKKIIRLAIISALLSTLISPMLIPEAQAALPFYSSSSDLCAASLDNTRQDASDFHTTVESKYANGYCYLRFTTETVTISLTNYWWLPTGITSFDYLVVAGGGGGGEGNSCGYESGGGGAGGLRYGTYSGGSAKKIILRIGAGGASNTVGSDSYINDGSSDVTYVHGGGSGGTCTNSDSSNGDGVNGGSGGGGSHNQNDGGLGNTSSYSPSEGNAGGKPSGPGRGGGGGGWGAAGSSDGSGGVGFVDTNFTYWPDQSNIAYYKLAFGGAGVVPGSVVGNTSITPGGISTGTGGAVNAGGAAVQDTGSGGGGSYASNRLAGGRGADGVIYIKYFPGQTDGLNLFCVADSGQDTINQTGTVDATTSTTSDAIFPYPGDTNFYRDYGGGGPRDCGTISGNTSDRWTEYLTGYVKAPVSSTSSDKLYLVALGDDGLILDVADDNNASMRSTLRRVYDDGANARVYGVSADTNDKTLPMADLSRNVNWTAGKWYPIRIWHHENGGGALFTLRYTKINPTTASDLNTATLTNFPRTNFSARRPVEATLSYSGLTGLAGMTFAPTYTVTSVDGVESAGAKTYSTSTGTVCSVNSSTGVATAIASGTCTVTLSVAATSVFAPKRINASFRIGVTPKMETDTAVYLASNSAPKNDNGRVIQDISSGQTGSFTFEAWIFPNSSGTIFQQGTPPSGGLLNQGIKIYLETPVTDTKLRVLYTGFGPNPVDCNRKIQMGVWTHVAIAFTLDRVSTTSKMQCFVNGFKNTELTAAASTLPTPRDAPLLTGITVGNNGSLNNSILGRIDEVKIWSQVRTQSQIQSDLKESTSPTASNLVAYYDFNEGEGYTVFNRKSGADSNSTDLTLTNFDSSNWLPIASASTTSAYTYWQFTRNYITVNNGWKVPVGVSKIRALIIGGGGGGGATTGGGGGAGGVIETITTVTAGGYTTVQVGQGGLGAKNSDSQSPDSGTSSIFGSRTANGGGGAGTGVSGYRNASNGGSGGGGSGGNGSAGSTNNSTSPGYGLGNNGGAGATAAGGGGGAGGAGGAAVTSTAGAGGAGYLSSITGSTVCYATGGGGADATNQYTLSNGGGCTGYPVANLNSGVSYYMYGTFVTSNTGSGGGGLNNLNDSSNVAYAQAGSDGYVVIRYITKTVPVYTTPAAVDTTTAGKAYKFVIGGSADSPLTRTYAWQWTNGTSNTWTTYATSDTSTLNFASPETMTSGPNYSYRVIITDGDTDGLSISETSSAFYLVINPRNKITASTNSFSYSQKYSESQTIVFSFSFGTGLRKSSVETTTANSNGYLSWSNLVSDSATLTINTAAWANTYYETLTVTDSVSATTSQLLTITVNKADSITVTTTLAQTTLTWTGNSVANVSRSVSGLKNNDAITPNATTCRTGGKCKVGDVAPGGGYVFYVSGAVIDSATGISDGGIYLATSPANNWTKTNICKTSGVSVTSGYSQVIGAGASNSLLASPSCTSGTAMYDAVNLSITDLTTSETFTDWFLPSDLELQEAIKLFKYSLAAIPMPIAEANGTSYRYWTSNFLTSQQAYYVNASTEGTAYVNFSSAQLFIGMQIRAFSPTKSTISYSALNCANGGTCAVGDLAPGGGRVFYISKSDTDTVSGISTGGKYLATAPAAFVGSGILCETLVFSPSSYKSTIGYGASNTSGLINDCSDSSTAARAIGAIYDINGYDDWFLPSQSEASSIFSALIYPPSAYLTVPAGYYWTSTLQTSETATAVRFDTTGGASVTGYAMNSVLYYLPIRAFNPTFITSPDAPTDAGIYAVGSTITLASPASINNYEAIVYVNTSLTIKRASQASLQFAQYGATVGTPYPFVVYGGTGVGNLYRSVVTPGALAQCTYNSTTYSLSAVAAGSCEIRAIKAGNPNLYSESRTATLFWTVYQAPSATYAGSGSHGITINVEDTFTARTETVTAYNFTNTGGGGITSASPMTTIRILVTGYGSFTSGDLAVYFRPYEEAEITSVSPTYIEVKVPTGAVTGRIAVNSPNGTAYSPSFTVVP